MARTSQWWRCNTTYPTDAKLRRAGPNGRMIWPHTCNAMKLQGGCLSDDDLDAFAMADIYGGTEEQWSDGLDGLKRIGWLAEGDDGWTIPGWERYQPDGRKHSKSRKSQQSRGDVSIPGIPREERDPHARAGTSARRPVPSRPVFKPKSDASDDLSILDGDPTPISSPASDAVWSFRRQHNDDKTLRLEAQERFDALIAWLEADPSRLPTFYDAAARAADKGHPLPYLLKMVGEGGALKVFGSRRKSTDGLEHNPELDAEIERIMGGTG